MWFHSFLIFMFTFILGINSSNASDLLEDLTGKKIPLNGFVNACQGPHDLQDAYLQIKFDRPPQRDQHGIPSKKFLSLIATRVKEKIIKNKSIAEHLLKCHLINFKDNECKSAKKWIQFTLPKFIKETRQHLVLAQSSYHVSSYLKILESDLNFNMSSLGTYKDVPWKKLNLDEKDEAQKKWNDIQEEFITKIGEQNKNELDSLLFIDRIKHFVQYQEHMARYPLIQFLESYDYSSSDFVKALNKFLETINFENEKLLTISRKLSDNDYLVKDSDLYLLKYSSLLEEFLIDNTDYCSVAASLNTYYKRKQIYNVAIVGLPILAVSFMAPPIAVTSIGLASAGYYGIDAQREFNLVKTRNLTQMTNMKLDELEELKSYYNERNLKVIMFGLSFGGYTTIGDKILDASQNLVYLRKVIIFMNKYL